MGDAHDRRFLDPVDGVDSGLDLLGVDVVAARDDQVAGPPDDRDIAVAVDAGEVAGDEEAVVAELGPGLLGIPPIALEDVGAAHLEHPGLAARHHPARRVHHPRLDARERRPHGAGAALRGERVRGVHAGLGHAVALEDGVAGAGVEGVEGLVEQRRRARDEETHAGAAGRVEAGVGEEPEVVGRHPHEHRCPGQKRDHPGGVEAGQEQHGAAVEKHAIDGHEEAVGVKDGEGVQEHVAGLEAPRLVQRQRVGRQVAVAQHGALGPPRGARGVEQGGEFVAAHRGALEPGREVAARVHERAAALRVQRQQVAHPGGPSAHPELRLPLGRADHDRRLGVGQHVLDLGPPVGGVERQVDGARAQTGEIE